MAPDLTDAQLDAIAERVAENDALAASIASKLPTGRLGGRYLLSRRQLLASAAGGATGVAALTALGIDEATAQAAAGQVGTPESPEDAYLAAVEAQSVSTESLVNDYQFAGAYDGVDADARLDAALSSVSDGKLIYLEAETYTANRAIDKEVSIVGTGLRGGSSVIDANWTLDDFGISLERVRLSEQSSGDVVTVNNQECSISNFVSSGTAAITVDANSIGVTNGRDIDVTLTSDSSRCVVDSLRGGSSVTDNGSGNAVGDIA